MCRKDQSCVSSITCPSASESAFGGGGRGEGSVLKMKVLGTSFFFQIRIIRKGTKTLHFTNEVKQSKEGLKEQNTMGLGWLFITSGCHMLYVTYRISAQRKICREKHQVKNSVSANSDFLVT